MHISNFRSSNNIDVYPDREHITARTNESHVINFRLNVQEGFPANAEANAAYPMRLDYLLFKDGKQYQHVRTERILSNEDLYSGKMHSLPIICPSEPGDYQLCIAISTGWLPASMNRGRIKLHISK